ncbi:MAG: LPS assembly lipoprotein LptE [Pseudomonadota bacterium]
MERTHVIWPPGTDREMRRELASTLTAMGVNIVNAPSEATAILAVRRNDRGQRVLSVSATNVPEEFEVYHVVVFDLVSGQEILLRNEIITLTRDYVFDETRVLAKEREQEIISQALARDMIRQIRRRLTLVN